MSELNPAQKFRREMEKLGLGVTIQVGDEHPIEVVPPPECDGSRDCRAEKHIQGCFRSPKEKP